MSEILSSADLSQKFLQSRGHDLQAVQNTL